MAFKKSLSALVFALPLVLGATLNRRAEAVPAKCQFLVPIVSTLVEDLFENECGDGAHGTLRLIFHDAIGISSTLGGGGADGSILTFNSTELNLLGNDGIDDVLANIQPFVDQFVHTGIISPGDFVQLAGAVGLTQCPGAPRIQFFLGRPQPKAPSPNFLVPEPFNTTDELFDRFADVGFSPRELVALLSSHSVAGADTVDPSIPGTPFDSTPAVFDTNIFIEVLLKGFSLPGQTQFPGELLSAVQGTMRLGSDAEIARDSRTACDWQALATDHATMVSEFSPAVVKLSLLGQNKQALTDCSSVIPAAIPLKDVPMFPPQQFLTDIQQSCAQTPFPNLTTAPGPALIVPPIPQS